MTLFTNPEAFALALSTLGGPRMRQLLRILGFLFRAAIAASLFFGGTPYLIHWYHHLMDRMGPLLDRTLNF